jgi:flavorubredoxin
MSARISEIEDGIYRLSVFVPEIGAPKGFTFNSFLIDGTEPMLFHAGRRDMFGLFSSAVGRIMPIERLKWISFGHVEADECGAMNLWLSAAPWAQVAHGQVGCDVSLGDLCDRAPRAMSDWEPIVSDDRRLIRWIDTPHVPHGWESGVIFDEVSETLFCGDLFTQLGDVAATRGDLIGPAIAAEEMFRGTSVGPATAPTLRRLAGFAPRRLALMHGPVFTGDGAGQLEMLADYFDGAMRQAA